MKTQKTQPPAPASAAEPEKSAPAEEAPITQACGLEKTAQGWRCVFIEMQGDRVLSKVYEDKAYGARAMALARLKIAVVRRLMTGNR